jgi:hypothetical protein
MRSLIFVSDFNKSNITRDYIVFFFAIRVKKFLYNMQFIMLSRSILHYLLTGNPGFHLNCGKTIFN